MADFNFNLNRQGPQGVQGPQGEPGFSPTISVDANTAAEYKLLITTVDGSFITDNLRGNAVENRGGTYMRFDPKTSLMFAGEADVASEYNYGEVIIASDEDIENGAEDKVVTADRIFDLNEVITTQGSTLTSLQTQIDTISGEIPDISGLATKSELSTEVSDRTAADTALDNKINNVFDAIPDVSGLATKAEVQAVKTQIPTQLSDLSDGSTVVTQTTLQTTLEDYVETTAITTTLTSQSTNEEVPGAKATYDWLNELTTTQTNQETRLSTIEDEYLDKRTDLKSSITPNDNTGAATPAAVYDFVTTEISNVTVDKATSTTLGTMMPDNETIAIDNDGVISTKKKIQFSTGLTTTPGTKRVRVNSLFDNTDTSTSITQGTEKIAFTSTSTISSGHLANLFDGDNTTGVTTSRENISVTYQDTAGFTASKLRVNIGSSTIKAIQLYGASISQTYSTNGQTGDFIITLPPAAFTNRTDWVRIGATCYPNGGTINEIEFFNEVADPDTTVVSADTTLVTQSTLTTEITAATSTMVTSTTVRQIVQVTQAQYDALATKDANTFYIITDAV